MIGLIQERNVVRMSAAICWGGALRDETKTAGSERCVTKQKRLRGRILSNVLEINKSPLFRIKIEFPWIYRYVFSHLLHDQLFRTRLFRIPRYFELIVLSLHLKSTPLYRTCQKQSTYIRAQLETYCILFELEQNIQRFFNATASADLSDI